MTRSEVEQYKRKVTAILGQLSPLLQRYAMGDFSKAIPIPKEDNEFSELFVGLNLMVDDIQEMMQEKEETIKKWKQAEREARQINIELNQNKAFIESVLDTSPDLIYVYDIVEKKNVYSNDGIRKVLGYSVAEIKEMGEQLIPLLMHPDDFKVYVNEILPRYAQARDKEIIEHEYRMKHKQGQWRWLYSKEAIFQRQDDGSPKQIFGIVNDISEEKRTRDELHIHRLHLQDLVQQRTVALQRAHAEMEDRVEARTKDLASEKDFSNTVINSMPGIFYMFDKRGKFVRWNKNFERVTEYTADAISKRTPLKYFSGATKKKIAAKILQVFTKGEAEVEGELVAKSSKHIPFYFTGKRVKIGKKSYLVGVGLDITERKQLERELRLKNIVFDSSIAAQSIADNKGIINHMNSAFLEMWGYKTKKEATGQLVSDFFVNPEDAGPVLEALIKKDKWEGEFLARKNDGSTFISRGFATVVRNEKGEQIGYQSTNLDITAQKNAEEMLQESEQYNRMLFEESPIGLVLCRMDGSLVYANLAYANIIGRSVAETLKMTYWDITPEKYAAQEGKQLESLKKTGRYGPYEKEYIHRDGHLVPVQLSGLILNQKGEDFIWSSVEDISERQKSEMERERLNGELKMKNKELEQVLYATSHDLRSPLVNIQGFNRELNLSLQDLKSLLDNKEIPRSIMDKLRPVLEEDIPESLAYILSSTSKMDQLLAGLLTLSRVGRQELNIKKLDMDNVVKEVLSTLEYQIQEKNIEVKVTQLPDCKGDELQISQIFANLVGNAIKFMVPGNSAQIKISGKTKKDRLLYAVEDNGIGIPAEHQGKIFELFHQLDPTKSGTGLGLTIVKQIIDKHNGHIYVDSPNGKGTKFTVSLPVEPKIQKEDRNGTGS